MAEKREIGGDVGAAQQLQSREEYLRRCDFSRLTPREWRRIGPLDGTLAGSSGTRNGVRLLGEFFRGGACTDSEKTAATCTVRSELAGTE